MAVKICIAHSEHAVWQMVTSILESHSTSIFRHLFAEGQGYVRSDCRQGLNYNNCVSLVRERTIPTERPPTVTVSIGHLQFMDLHSVQFTWTH
jgi:hypothetical protein